IILFLQTGGQRADLNKIGWRSEDYFNKELYVFDYLFRSPGWPLDCPGIKEAVKKNKKIIISSPMNIFFSLCETKNIISVSGTKGKGTTASLIAAILRQSKKRFFLGGNIGIAPLAFLEKIKKNDWVILELSSFQLEDLKFSPKIAVITNLYKEHLAPADPHNPNYHKNYKSYWLAKYNLINWQKKGDVAVINPKLKSKIIRLKAQSKIIYFKNSNLDSGLVGEYYRENIGAAVTVAKVIGISENNIKLAVKNFKNLEHRLELVREVKKISYYDNSFSTTPESTILDLKSFKQNIVLLLGGADKGADFKLLAKEIKKRVKLTVLLAGVGTDRIIKELDKISYLPIQRRLVFSMKEAVKVASRQASAGDVVLLSTACASFGMFKNYKERGNLFQQEVKKLSD
nr:UDP-N-acetylmuramoyl-L-alanine--D-glutamate ligase [Planctomycetota bacterium]